MSADMPAMDECCPDHGKSNPCDQPNDQCGLAFCAGQWVSLASATTIRFHVPMVTGDLLPIPADQVASFHSGSLPFRPPRV